MAIYKLQTQSGNSNSTKIERQHLIDEGPALQANEHIIIELIAASLEHKGFHAVSHTLVNELARHLKCERVSLRINRAKQNAPHAISFAAGVSPESHLINSISDAMNEAQDQKSTIIYPPLKEDKLLITSAHSKLASKHPHKSICTVLLTHVHEIIGVLTLERLNDNPFDEDTIFFCQRIALLISPIILLKYEEENWLKEYAWARIKKSWDGLTGKGHYTEKASYISGLLVILFLLFATGTHRVSGVALLEGKIQRVITSPIDGFISEVHVRAGDIVTSGQLMAHLDDRELQLQKMKLQGSYDSFSREYRDARAKYDLTQVSITSAKMQQAKAELNIIREQLKRLQMTAPFDGVIIEGNLEQALGSPVERGQVLLKIAPLDDYRIILKIDDRDIAWINTQQIGHLVLASQPDTLMTFTIKNITPVSIAEDGRNFFKVEAQLKEKNVLLRPGMHGVAKIEIGERKLVWIWLHRFTDWLRFTIWSF
ncbi:MAG: HlyD family efflux transporter periplasmic adaptor subunit [Gammaproteobacteria bacterium]|nr:HlyD family efflux transporter periplasmic adaptor subunit [Gammaproteobacteria bacterium]